MRQEQSDTVRSFMLRTNIAQWLPFPLKGKNREHQISSFVSVNHWNKEKRWHEATNKIRY